MAAKTFFILINGLRTADTYLTRDAAFDAAIALDDGTTDIVICTTHRGVWVEVLRVADISS